MLLQNLPHQLVHLDIIPDAAPHHLCAFPMAHVHLDGFKAEF